MERAFGPSTQGPVYCDVDVAPGFGLVTNVETPDPGLAPGAILFRGSCDGPDLLTGCGAGSYFEGIEDLAFEIDRFDRG